MIEMISPSNSAGITGSVVFANDAPADISVVEKAPSALPTSPLAAIVRPIRLTDVTSKPSPLNHSMTLSTCLSVGPKRLLNSPGVSH